MDEANALTSAREFDALKDEDVTPLPESKPHVVFRLRREEDEIAPWFVELVFLLFNAQGDVLQVVRGFKPPEAPTSSVRSTGNSGVVYFGEDNFRIARAKSKEAREREVVRFSMEKIHPFVEVVGCLVTYVEDEIARSPQLNAFSLTCDLHAVDSAQAEADAQALAAGGRRFVFDAGERVRLLEFVHDPKARRKLGSVQPNVLVLCKLYRRRGNYRDWACHAATDDRSSVVVRSAVTGTLVEAMQVFMLDIMPDIKIPNRKPLSSVAGICAALSRNDFSGIESHFPEKGLPKLDFARLLLFELMRTRPRLLQHVDRATVLVSILFEMFEQIDINGDGIVDWEEFTSFALGLIATRGRNDDNDQDQHGDGDSQDAPPRATITYRQDPLSTATASRSFPYQVNKLKTFVQLKRLAVIESKSSRILMFDMDMNFLHELNCGEKLAAEKKAGDKQQDVLETLEVLDAEHVPARNALAVASNDLCISVWSIIDATIGTYVFNGKLIGRFPALFVKCAIPQALAAAQEDGSGDDTPGLSPTRNVIFNSVTNTFVGVVENRITVWNANSGAKIEVPVVVRDAEICAMVFDSPRERKLFVATNDGAVRQYNPVTGALLFKTVVHEGIVSSLVFCSHANLLVSTGDDRSICVLSAPAGKATLEVLHTVERAHKSSITCSACSPPPSSNDTQTTAGEQTSTAASAWKFVRRDHAGGSDEKGLYERIAGEVIAKHRRKQKKEMKARNKHHSQRDQEALSRSAIGLSSVNSTLEMEMQPKKSPERQPAALSLFPDSSLAMTNAATALLTQLPFSATSVTTGIHQGIFRPEEAQHLRTLATKSSGLMADVADKRKRLATLAPLFQSAEEMGRIRAKAKAKARAAMNKGQDPAEISQAGTRFLTNYPLELERRAAANAAHATSSWHALDIEPSQFLLKKLPGAASPLRTPIKSTPKKRLIRSPVKLAQASMSPAKLQRNVSLPKLTAPASGHEPDESAHSSETLTSSASTPALRHTTPLLGERISSPNPDKLRSNVERKLKLCEKIVASVCLMTTHKSPKEPQARGSTPGSPGTKTRPTPSSISSMSSILAQGKNPFGPNYTVKQVEHLAVELARLDEDGSGDLDQREWMHLVQLCGLAGADAKDAVTSMDNLFHALDRDSSGAISIRELLPTLFTHATPDQLQQMRVLVQTRMKEIREKPIPQAAANSATTDATDNSTSE
ncbi:hypothetical protein PHYBOEH_012050 [Phytophthora boehmeriae]|uniref:EF-hand domain-containing protein n=1 Tax=Phytophthora boehmeriae TaxID=109152 RepID=A0A8T1X1N0_9STRA|nr:hypothetical protein PHYBOEH_012050 [Phytophthora boehmeriae]